MGCNEWHTYPDDVELKNVIQRMTMDKIPLSQGVDGMIVRQIKPDRGLRLPGNATVMARRAGLVECTYQGKKHTIDATCLEVVE